MQQQASSTLDPTIFDRNIEALRKVDPVLATRVEQADDPSIQSWTPARTRDGQTSIQLTDTFGHTTWLGRTSVPLARAEALLDQFEAGNTNVLLPGAAEGSEIELLIRHLGVHRAVFVWEENPYTIQHILRIHNLDSAMRDERLIWLVCPFDELDRALLAWLVEHPGHLCPNRILLWPWHTAGDLAPCRSRIETVYQQIEQQRQRDLVEITRHPKRQYEGIQADEDAPPSPLTVFSLHAQQDTWDRSDALISAAEQLGTTATPIDIRNAGDMHTVSRAKRFADASPPPEWAILLDVVREQLGGALAQHCPAISWLFPRADRAYAPTSAPVAVAHPAMLAEAQAAGLEADRLHICPPPCMVSAAESDQPKSGERDIDVLMVARQGPVDPKILAPSLPTYARIFHQAARLVSDQIETFTDDRADTVLKQVEARLGSRIDDSGTRKEVTSALGSRLANPLLVRFLANALISKGIACRIVGHGWGELFPDQALHPPVHLVGFSDLLRRTKILVHADVTGLATADVLLASGCGAAVVARRHPTDKSPGGLQTLLASGQEMELFRHVPQLLQAVQRLLQAPSERDNLADRARLRIQAEHTCQHRLRTLEKLTSRYFPKTHS